MKITIELPDALIEDARRMALRRGTTLELLVEAALRQLVEAEGREQEPFRLRHCTFGGEGLRPELLEASWDEIRSLIDRGPTE